ncbi:MAG: hypothetical protein IPM50_01385 [Acidobacteriota bacterium]|nr:MAG: hypothetical protein IPM50_01385 [Acidobacteriota bacterium]
MSAILEVEQLALGLSTRDRGALISKLIESLGSPFRDEDKDIVELARQRDEEASNNPELIISEEEFWDSIKQHRRK